ncbi:MAG TPA: DUF3037 domain-containing protein [Polyangiaceae bacterium]
MRVVPLVEREEFVNAGVVLFCDELDFLEARIDLDEARLSTMAPRVDLAAVCKHLDAIPVVCGGGPGAGPIGELPVRERWRWIIAPRSTIVQMSPAHPGLCDEPRMELERLMARLVRT